MTYLFGVRYKLMIHIQCLSIIYTIDLSCFSRLFLHNMLFFVAGIVGESENKGESLYMWTHKKFEIGYNDIRVSINIKLICDIA